MMGDVRLRRHPAHPPAGASGGSLFGKMKGLVW